MNTYRKIALASLAAYCSVVIFWIFTVAPNHGLPYGAGDMVVVKIDFGSDARVYLLDHLMAIPLFGYVIALCGCFLGLLGRWPKGEFAGWFAASVILFLAFGALNEVRTDILHSDPNFKIALVVLIWGSKLAFLTSSAFWLGLFDGGAEEAQDVRPVQLVRG